MKKKRKIPDESQINKSIEFFNFAKKLCKEPDKIYEFDCPACGSKARAIASSVNGHVTAQCSNHSNCGMWVIE